MLDEYRRCRTRREGDKVRDKCVSYRCPLRDAEADTPAAQLPSPTGTSPRPQHEAKSLKVVDRPKHITGMAAKRSAAAPMESERLDPVFEVVGIGRQELPQRCHETRRNSRRFLCRSSKQC